MFVLCILVLRTKVMGVYSPANPGTGLIYGYPVPFTLKKQRRVKTRHSGSDNSNVHVLTWKASVSPKRRKKLRHQPLRTGACHRRQEEGPTDKGIEIGFPFMKDKARKQKGGLEGGLHTVIHRHLIRHIGGHTGRYSIGAWCLPLVEAGGCFGRSGRTCM